MNRPTLHQSSGCAFFRRSPWLQRLILSLLAPGMMTCLSPVRANPQGGSVVHGDIHFGAGTGGNLQIHQGSANAIINWDSFSIAAGELTQFLQPG
ncbi:MAG: hypothetical protein GXX91_05185, partial [Verrucomicrobiaceae bacterium]|nr:hypothetical protein [Verrucomicrobiaceae bacterium]